MSEETTIVEETIANEEQIEETQDMEDSAPIDNRTPEQKEVDRIKRKAEKTRARIEELSADKLSERRRNQALEAKIAELENKLNTDAPKKSNYIDSNAPKADDFPAGKYDPDYLIALTKHEIQQSIDNLQKSANVGEQRKLVEAQQQQARQTYDDYDDVTADLLDHPLANDPIFNDAILASDNVAEVAYYLGKNEDQLDILMSLRNNPAKMLKQIGRIESLLESQKPLEPAKKQVSNAPRPVSPVGSARHETTRKKPEDMTTREYAEYMKNGYKYS